MLFEDPATPAGMLTDEQAAAIRAAGGPTAAPPEYRDFYTAHLNQYDSFRQSHPRALDLQEMARKDRVLEDLTLDFDKATAGQDLMSLRMAPDEATRAAAKDSLTVDTYIRSKTGRGFNGATRAKMRDAVATTLFGEGKGLGSDSAFVAEARKYQTKGRETRIQAESFASAGAWDALKLEPGDSMADLARIQESAKAVQGMTPEDADRFVGTYQRMREETEARVAPHRPLAKAVRELLEVQAAKKYTGDGGDEDFGLALDLMLSLPDEAVPLVFSMIRGKKAPDDKPGVQKGAENIERGFISRLRTFAEPTLRGRLMDLGRSLEAGAPLTIRDGDSVEQAVLRRVGETTLPMAEAGQASVEGQAFHDYFNSRTATPAENRQAAETVRRMLDRNVMAGRLVNLSEQTVDPATSSGFYARSLYSTAYSIGAMAPVFIPYAGLVIAQGSYANDEFHRLVEMGMDAETANFNSQITGGIQAGLERLGVRALTAGYSNLAMRAGSSRVGTAIGNVLYKLPGLNRAAPGVLPLNAAGRVTGGLGLTQAGEYLEEVAQDATPIFTAALAERMGMTLPEQATMEAEVKRFKFWNPEMYLSLLPITGAMGGFRSLQNNSDAVRQRDALLADPVAMRAAGAAPDLAERVAALSAGERAEAWRAEAPRLDPSTETAGEAQETLMGRQTLAARRSVEEQQAAGIAAIRRTDSGWQVERMDGVTVSVSSAEAAESMVRDLAQASTLREAEALVSIADQWHREGVPQEGRQTTFTGAVTRGTNEGIFRERNGQMVQEVTDEETLRNLREEAMMDGATDVNVIINGSNRAFTETVADGALRVVQSLEVNQTVSSVVTLLHEQSERNLRRLLDSGSVTETDMVSALNFAAIALPESAVPESDAAGKAFRQRVTRGAMGELSMGEMRETVVELAVADTLGRRKDGGRFEAGAVTRALTASIQSAGSAAELKGIQRFLAMLKAVRAYLRGVMGTVAGLRKARRDGKLAEGNTLDALIDRITGRDQQKAHNEAVAEEVAREQREESPAAPEVWGRWAAAQPPLSQAEKRAIGALTPKLRAAYDRIVQRNGGSRTVGLTALGVESGIPEEDMQRWVLEYGINQGMAVLALDGIRLNDSAGQSPADGAASFSVSSRAQPVEPDAPVRDYGNASVVGPTTFSITAYHGTPHAVDKFSTANIGTGEGSQAFGWGLYFAEAREVADGYRTSIWDYDGSEEVTTADGQPFDEDDIRHEAGRYVQMQGSAGEALEFIREAILRNQAYMENGGASGPEYYQSLIQRLREAGELIEAGDYAEVKTRFEGGNFYTVELALEDSQLLKWDSADHNPEARAALTQAYATAGLGAAPDGVTAEDAVRDLAEKLGSPQAASEHLLTHGIRGIRYLDGDSRGNDDSGGATYNYVVFSDADIKITEANGVAMNAQNSRAVPVEPEAPVREFRNASMVGPATFSISAYHGTPHRVREFSTKNIGTGEGNQAFGWGLYFAQSRQTAEWYQQSLSDMEMRADGQPYDAGNERHLAGAHVADYGVSGAVSYLEGRAVDLESRAGAGGGWAVDAAAAYRRQVELIRAGDYAEVREQPTGNLYTVEIIPDESEFLDWDGGPNSPAVRAALGRVYEAAGFPEDSADGVTGQGLMFDLRAIGGPQAISEHLLSHGIKGIKYLDGVSRGGGKGTYNYVVFSDADIRITAENGQARSQDSSVTFSLGRNPGQRVPVVAVPDTKLKGGSIREIRKDATVYAAEHGIYGRHLNDDTGWEIAVTSDSLTHAFTHMGPQQIHSVPSLPDLIRSAVHVATERHRDNNRGFTEVHRMRAAMEFRGGLHSVKLSVKEHREQGRSLYDLKAVEIKREPGGNVLPVSPAEAETSGPAPGSTVTLAEIAPEVNQSPDAGASFSLSSVSALEAVAAKLEARMAAGGPEAKLTVLGDIARTVAGMARAARYNEETENVIAAGRIEERRRALRQELLERYTLEVLESPVGMALLNDEAVSVRDLTVTGQVLDLSRKGLHGVFLAPSKAKKAGMRLAGEYDDAAGLPGWMFHGERTPDQVAASLGMDVAEMWATIHDELASMRRMREYRISAREQMAEARVRAGTEAAEWASQQRAKLAVSDARDARRALVTLDAMIAKLPAEVRRSVGGFTPVADLKTNKAREEYFLRTVDKIDRALERHLRREYQERTRVLFRKAAVKAKPGQGDRGGLTVNGHTWFQQAEIITRMSERELAEREAWVRSRLTGAEELTAAEVTELNRMWDFGGGVDGATLALEQEDALLNLFGGFSHTEADGSPARSALELETAMKAAQEQLTAGRTKWEEAITERRMWRVTRRLQLQNDSKTTGLPDAIAARKKALEGFGGRMQDFFQKGFSFEQLIGDIFKRGSATHQYAERTARSAEIKAKADWMSKQLQFQDFLKTIWPRSASTARLKKLEELATRRKVPNAPQGLPEMSELEAVHYTMLWADQDSRDWLAHHKFGDDAQNAMEAWLSPAARSIRTWLQERYDSQYDEINEIYRRIHGVNMPRVANYAPRHVEHGQKTSTMDPLNPASGEGLGVFAGFTKRRRPQISSMPTQIDALSAFWANQRTVGHWRAWAEPMRELRAVFSSPETAPYIKAAAGEKAANMVNQWLTDMEQGGRREVMTVEAMRRFLSTNADNALVGKLGVLAKQVPASYGSAAEIGWDNWLASVRRIVTGKASITLEQIYNSQVMRQRRWADLPETLQSAHGTGTHPFARALRKVGVEIHAIDTALDWMRQRIGWTDAFFTTLSAAAAYDAHYRDAITSGSTEAEARAAAEARASITVARTAQPDSLVNKSIYENGLGTWGRLFFAFQSANRQALFMTAAAFRDGGVKSGEAWRKALTHWMVTGIVTQTLGSLVRDWVSDDDDEEIWTWGGYVRAVLMGPLTGALYLGTLADVASGLMGGFERRSGTGLGAAVGEGAHEVARIMSDEDAAFDLKSFDKVARGFGYALGGRASGLNILANLWKQMEGAADNAWETEAERIEGKANKQREAEKEKKKTEADKLPEDEKARRKQEKKAQKEAKLRADAEAWDREHPEGE